MLLSACGLDITYILQRIFPIKMRKCILLHIYYFQNVLLYQAQQFDGDNLRTPAKDKMLQMHNINNPYFLPIQIQSLLTVRSSQSSQAQAVSSSLRLASLLLRRRMSGTTRQTRQSVWSATR